MKALATGVGLTAAAVLALQGPASAAADPMISFAGPAVVAAGGTVSVPVTYTCTSTDSPGNHLFAAVKQGPHVNTTDQSGSDFANSFFSTNWSADAGPNAVTCDGQEHTQTLVLLPQGTHPPLHPGMALVQLCLYDNLTGQDPITGEPIGGSHFDYTMQPVAVLHGR